MGVSSSPRRVLLAFTCAAMLAAFWGARSVSAQALNRYALPPISSDDLETYVELLGLTREQRAALEDPFEQYQSDCSALRQNEIAQFMADRQAHRRRPTEERLDGRIQRQFLRRCLALRARLATFDDQFFLAMEETLGDGVAPESIQRLKRLRERARALPMSSGSSVAHEIDIDLTQLLRLIDMGEEDRLALEPILVGYEAALTPALTGLAKKAIERRFVFEGTEDYYRQHLRLIERGIDIIDLNRRWMETMAGAASADVGERLRVAYQRAAYRGLLPDHEGAHRAFDAALQLRDLTDEQRASLAAQRDAYVAEHAAVTERLISMIDRLRREATFWRSMYRSDIEPPSSVVEARRLQARRKTLNTEAKELLTTYLGSARMLAIGVETQREFASGMHTRWTPVRLPPVRLHPRSNSLKIANSTMRMGPYRGSPMAVTSNPYSHPLISRDAMTALLDQAGAAESQRSTILKQFDAYKQELVAKRRTLGEELATREAAMWARGEDDSFQPPDDHAINALRQSYNDAHAELKQLDEAMFDRLAELAQTPQPQGLLTSMRLTHMRRFCLWRMRSRLYVGGYVVGGHSQLYELDLLGLLTDIRPPVENAAQFTAIAQSYERRATDLAKERFVASMDAKILGERALAHSFTVGERNYEFDLTAAGPAGDAFRRACGELGAAEKQYYQLNVATYQQLHALLEPQTARSLRRSYQLAAFPEATEDSTAMHETLGSTVRDAQLAVEQRELVLELQVEYVVKYEVIMERLVSTVRPPSKLALYQFDDAGHIVYHAGSEEYQQYQEIVAIQFERDELNAATQRKLADIRAGVNAAN